MWEEGELTEAFHLGEEDMRNQVNQAVLSNGDFRRSNPKLHKFAIDMFVCFSISPKRCTVQCSLWELQESCLNEYECSAALIEAE